MYLFKALFSQNKEKILYILNKNTIFNPKLKKILEISLIITIALLLYATSLAVPVAASSIGKIITDLESNKIKEILCPLVFGYISTSDDEKLKEILKKIEHYQRKN